MPIPTIDKRERADMRSSADLGVLIRFANTASPKQSPPAIAAEYCSMLVEET
jgi:hypothetical protein